jgi:hypothetical protein
MCVNPVSIPIYDNTLPLASQKLTRCAIPSSEAET